jgi:hypothetical protein
VSTEAQSLKGYFINFLLRNKEWTKQESTIISTITAGLADGLLITSITFSLSCIIQRHRDNITAYHYDLVCYLSLAATFTSITASFSTPVLAEKRFPSGVRLVGYFLAIGLLGGILGPITKPAKAGHTFPARAPTLDLANLKQSALVLQASCFIETNVTKECTYKTDQTLLPLLTGYVLISIIIFATVGTSINQLWRNWWYDGDSQTPIKEVALLRLMFELTAVLFSTAVSAVAFWQFYTLRKYMSKSGWLSNETELGVSSFGQLLPILQVLFIFLVIANSFEGKRI